MDDILYILIIIIIFVLTIFYGGHNLIKNIEYYNNYFNSNNIIIFDNKLKKFNFDENIEKILDVSKYIDLSYSLIPNLIICYIIKLDPYEFFDVIKKLYNDQNKINDKNFLMVILNHDKNNIELLLNIENNIGNFYLLTQKISILDIYIIYNNSSTKINFTLFIINKPYWNF